MYSNNLSTIATVSSSIISEFFPACFSCSNKLNLLHSSLGSEDVNIVLDFLGFGSLVLRKISF